MEKAELAQNNGGGAQVMATRKKAVKQSGFQQALHAAIQRAWTDPAVAQHAFFTRWAVSAELPKLLGDAVFQHCLTCPKPNLALHAIADVVAELDWPAARTITGVHSRVVELVELMTLVLCERRIQTEVEDQKLLAQTAPAGDLLVLPMNNRLAAGMVAAVWLKLHVKLVLDESGQPAALNLLSDLPPQEFGWTDARKAAKAEVMAHLGHVRGGDRHCPESARLDQLGVVKRQGVLGDSDLGDLLQLHVKRGGARPAFGFPQGANVGLDSGTRLWLRNTFGIECFAVDSAAAATADVRFEELQAFLLPHLENIITRVHAGAAIDVKQGKRDSRMSKRTKVFISYSHADKRKWLPLLQKKLAVLETQGLLDLWDDTRIKPGDDWYVEIDQALKDCQIALLLISDEFLSSRFIQQKEMVDLLEKHKGGGLRLYPVLLRDCLWEAVPDLKRLQIKMTQGAKPLETCKPAERNAVLTQIGRDLLQAVQPDAAGAV